MPWSAFWERNSFAAVAPWVERLIRNGFVRGAVSGIGVVTLVAGLLDLAALLSPRRR